MDTEDRRKAIKDELLLLKANVYDVSKEVNYLNGILAQTNTKIEELSREYRSLEQPAVVKKPVKNDSK